MIPYRTSYYAENWGFCLAALGLRAAARRASTRSCIDSTLEDGELIYAERFLPGESDEEVLLSTYICHPSLANDNLSGVVLAATLARASRRTAAAALVSLPLRARRRSGRSPGSRATSSGCRASAAGLVVSCVGDPGPFTYKRSRRGDSEIDRAAAAVLGDAGRIEPDFTPLGTDERQFCSPGFNLPVGALSRTPTDRFPEYHSSADDLDFVRPRGARRVVRALPRRARRAGAQPHLPEPEPEGRAAARQARPLPGRRRRLVHRGPAALGAEPLRRRARPAGDRRTLRD